MFPATDFLASPAGGFVGVRRRHAQTGFGRPQFAFQNFFVFHDMIQELGPPSRGDADERGALAGDGVGRAADREFPLDLAIQLAA